MLSRRSRTHSEIVNAMTELGENATSSGKCDPPWELDSIPMARSICRSGFETKPDADIRRSNRCQPKQSAIFSPLAAGFCTAGPSAIDKRAHADIRRPTIKSIRVQVAGRTRPKSVNHSVSAREPRFVLQFDPTRRAPTQARTPATKTKDTCWHFTEGQTDTSRKNGSDRGPSTFPQSIVSKKSFEGTSVWLWGGSSFWGSASIWTVDVSAGISVAVHLSGNESRLFFADGARRPSKGWLSGFPFENSPKLSGKLIGPDQKAIYRKTDFYPASA